MGHCKKCLRKTRTNHPFGRKSKSVTTCGPGCKVEARKLQRHTAQAFKKVAEKMKEEDHGISDSQTTRS